MDLGSDVGGCTKDPRGRRACQAGDGTLDLLERLVPRSPQAQDLRTMDQALPPVEDELWLSVAPPAQSGCPLPRPSDVEQLSTAVDHGAVGVSDRDGGDLVGSNGDHRFVQERDTCGDLARVDEAAPLSDAGEGRELDVLKALRHAGRLVEARQRLE